MPFCPICKYEYNIECSFCPDCDERLVAVLPLEPETEEELQGEKYKDWIKIAQFNSDLPAKLILETLRMNDVPAIVISDTGHFGQTGQMGPSSFNSIGGNYSLMIPREKVIEADEIGLAILGEDWTIAKSVDIERE